LGAISKAASSFFGDLVCPDLNLKFCNQSAGALSVVKNVNDVIQAEGFLRNQVHLPSDWSHLFNPETLSYV